MDKIPGPGEQTAEPDGFAAYWRRDVARQKEQTALNEQRMDACPEGTSRSD